eukprot:CAMPEP_0178444198 /NCGR_PEP_ID=MMETSP0689_2-20121128/39351_1 /TAXON_ID=160604 /ORGANISM="Amphidinium massartii, Strain CS-259" /LENGTH=290 /DNA_ID=CAMNT_0020068357 /DNA_START=35 /DNA_END=904 /DNA_ORIENTATION=+
MQISIASLLTLSDDGLSELVHGNRSQVQELKEQRALAQQNMQISIASLLTLSDDGLSELVHGNRSQVQELKEQRALAQIELALEPAKRTTWCYPRHSPAEISPFSFEAFRSWLRRLACFPAASKTHSLSDHQAMLSSALDRVGLDETAFCPQNWSAPAVCRQTLKAHGIAWQIVRCPLSDRTISTNMRDLQGEPLSARLPTPRMKLHAIYCSNKARGAAVARLPYILMEDKGDVLSCECKRSVCNICYCRFHLIPVAHLAGMRVNRALRLLTLLQVRVQGNGAVICQKLP